jgi:hypothetical protein
MLHVGQHIRDKEDEWVVLELLNQRNHTPRVRIRVEKIGDHMRKFLTLGKEYVLRQGNRMAGSNDHFVWVVPDKQMKATSSQVLLYDFPDVGPKLDIDF